ncbi:YdcF family protein [Halocynthiibacter styelae]|uniref:YdcF family protein n=1 Tax=Halocynthiibacter styelae TaxID=2761955 RepID=A0A8J7LKA2_9RHOB|nr:YdcF family protein [Paenihalocynthiibacter styelae]MBI1492144.1 YdcF family protein [Paenihalocynthiibacter styelae]
MIKLFRRFLALVVFTFVTLLIFIPSFAFLQDLTEPEEFATADVIMVFGAGMDADGTLHASTILRVEKGVILYQQGAAPRLHMSGGMARDSGPSAGDQMRALAVRMGVTHDVITSETRSLSTLQNALFSLPDLPQNGRIIAVSEGFHLPRVWASLHWAALNDGRSFDIALSNSEPFRSTSPSLNWPEGAMVWREVLATGFNALRAAAWQASGIMGAENRDDWLK